MREDNDISLNQQRASEVLAPRRPCATLCLRACPPRSSAPFWGGAGVAGQPRSRRVHSRRIISDRIFFILSSAVTRTSQSPHHRPGPYHPLECAVHRFDNMVLDAVLAGEAAESQQAAERQQAGRQAVRRHRVAPRTRSPACRLPARVGGVRRAYHAPARGLLRSAAAPSSEASPGRSPRRWLSGGGGGAQPYAVDLLAAPRRGRVRD